MDSKTLWAIVLSMLVLLAFQFFFAKTAPPPQPFQKEAPAPAPQAEAPRTPAVPAIPAQAGIPEAKTVRVETDKFIADFSSIGAVPESWTLKDYKDQKDKTKDVSLLRPGIPLPLGIAWGGEFRGGQMNFSVKGENLTLNKANPQGTLAFEYSDGTHFVRRTYAFHYNTYEFELRDEVSGLPDYMITLGPEFGIYQRDGAGFHTGPVLLSGTDRIEIKAKKLDTIKIYTEDIKWIAQEDKYFFAALVPRQKMDAQAWAEKGNALVALKTNAPMAMDYVGYAGPKEIDRLKHLGLGLENVVDFGTFSIIARPILWLLKQIQKIVINWGWAIIILTIVTRIPFIPLINKGQKSMKKLQALQPRMQELRQKYKKDPQRLQRETMELYKKYKVNPMGGCLPILIQIPVFFALYKVLAIAIELRGAPFALWIMDLSQKDPYYVLPIIMGVTMLIQQRMTPTGGDPRQQKMMMFMPVIFTFLFLNFASGLVLYWLVNNLLSIAQQVWVNKKAKVEE
jgi:YidC/Oxa1 family membrane protein insertase